MNAPRQLKPRRGVPFIAQGKAPRRRSPVTGVINLIRAVSASEQLLTAAFVRTYSAQLIVVRFTGLRAHSSRLPCATNGTPRWGFGLSRPRAVTITASSHLSKGETHLSTHTFARLKYQIVWDLVCVFSMAARAGGAFWSIIYNSFYKRRENEQKKTGALPVNSC